MRKCVPHCPVKSYSSLQENLFPYRALAFHFREIVLGNRVYEAGENVVAPQALLLRDADIRIDECRASRLEFHRR